MSVELLTEHHLEFLSLEGGCTGSSEYTHVKMPHCWKSPVVAHMLKIPYPYRLTVTVLKARLYNWQQFLSWDFNPYKSKSFLLDVGKQR